MPTIAELQTLVDPMAVDCGVGGPCIDPIFGTTQSTHYFSITSVADYLPHYLAVNFASGTTAASFKDFQARARAVRGGW